jgi:hypothetical protein
VIDLPLSVEGTEGTRSAPPYLCLQGEGLAPTVELANEGIAPGNRHTTKRVQSSLSLST